MVKKTAKKISKVAANTTKKTAKHTVKHAKKAVHHTKKISSAAATKKRARKSSSTKSQVKKIGLSAKAQQQTNTTPKKPLNAYNYAGKRQARKIEHRKNKAAYLASLPKSRIKRFVHRMHPKRFFVFWFSKRGFFLGLKLAGISVVAGFVFVIGLFAWFRRDLPDPDTLSSRQLVQTTEFYDRTGETRLFEVYGDERRKVVPFDEISQDLVNATVAIEDESFYEHSGFSFEGIARALRNNVTNSGGLQGGSTITQQFVKNSLLSNEQTITRKLKELILSIELERRYSKEEILGFYLNEISYGGTSYGVQAASEIYFDKDASDLTLDESATLAALPQAPGNYNPYGENTDQLIDRRDVVLDKMVELGYTDRETADAAQEADTLANLVPIEDQDAYNDVVAPHFVEKVRELLIQEYGTELVQNGGLKVTTTLDLELQSAAESAVIDNFWAVEANNGDNAALSSTDVDTGQVLAQVGSRDFFYPGYGSVNAASPEGGRQPGSSFKPFGYSQLFLDNSWGPGSTIWDTDTTFLGSYSPDNFDKLFPGAMTIRQALGRSRNIPAVKALYIGGVESTVQLARDLGNKALCGDCYDNSFLSIVLGAGEVKLDEHTHAYSAFARGGVAKDQAYLLKVENAADEVLYEWKDTAGEQVLDPQVAYLITDILSDDAARSATFGAGNGNLVVPGLNHTVKTGSTDRSVDGWMMGYTTCTAVGVWVGNHDGQPMDSITSRQTGPIFTQFLRESENIRGCAEPSFERPAGIKTVTLNKTTGRIASSNSRTTTTDIFPSWYEAAPEGQLQTFTIDTVSNKLATECTPDAAKQTVRESGVLPEIPEIDPEFTAWSRSAPYGSGGGTITAEDDVHKCNDKEPTVKLSINRLGNASSTRYQLVAAVTQGTHGLGNVRFFVNGSEINNAEINGSGSYGYTHDFESGGNYNVSVQIEDDALYRSTDSESVSINGQQATPSNVSLLSPSSGAQTSNPVTVSWNASGPIDGFNICTTPDGGSTSCAAAPGSINSATLTLGPLGDFEIYIEALDDDGNVLDTSGTNIFELQ